MGSLLESPPAPSWPWVSSSRCAFQTHMRQLSFLPYIQRFCVPFAERVSECEQETSHVCKHDTNGNTITAPNSLRQFLEANIKNIFMTLGICKNFLNSAQK